MDNNLSSSLQPGSCHPDRDSLFVEAVTHANSRQKTIRKYRFQNSYVHLVCANQLTHMRKLDKEHTQLKKVQGDTNISPKTYDIKCAFHIKATPIPKDHHLFTNNGYIIKSVSDHSCVGPTSPDKNYRQPITKSLKSDAIAQILNKLPAKYKTQIPANNNIKQQVIAKLCNLESKFPRQVLCKGDSKEARIVVILQHILLKGLQGIQLKDGQISISINVPLVELGRIVGMELKDIERVGRAVSPLLKAELESKTGKMKVMNRSSIVVGKRSRNSMCSDNVNIDTSENVARKATKRDVSNEPMNVTRVGRDGDQHSFSESFNEYLLKRQQILGGVPRGVDMTTTKNLTMGNIIVTNEEDTKEETVLFGTDMALNSTNSIWDALQKATRVHPQEFSRETHERWYCCDLHQKTNIGDKDCSSSTGFCHPTR